MMSSEMLTRQNPSCPLFLNSPHDHHYYHRIICSHVNLMLFIDHSFNNPSCSQSYPYIHLPSSLSSTCAPQLFVSFL